MNGRPADLEAQLAEISEKGFTIARDVIAETEIAELKAALESAIADDLAAWHGRDYVNANMVFNLMTRGTPFVRLLENEVLHSFLSPILGDTCILYAYTSSSMPPAGTNYSRRIHVDCPRFIPEYVTNIGITLALDDFTAENGAMALLPGSHKVEAAPTEDQFAARGVRAYPRAGDAIVFNARTWHRGGVNRTSEYRHAVTMNVCRSYMRQQFDFPRLVSPEVVEMLGERGRRFLGFNVRMPSSLEEYYLPEDRRLYKAGQG